MAHKSKYPVGRPSKADKKRGHTKRKKQFSDTLLFQGSNQRSNIKQIIMVEENTKIPDNTAKDVRGVPFKAGDDPRRNLEGRPKGSKNFTTLFDEAIIKIAEEGEVSDVEIELVKRAVKKAMTGDYSFYRDVMDRKFGKPVQPTDVTSGGETINPILVKFINGKDNNNS